MQFLNETRIYTVVHKEKTLLETKSKKFKSHRFKIEVMLFRSTVSSYALVCMLALLLPFRKYILFMGEVIYF